jgi:hypothetical protein
MLRGVPDEVQQYLSSRDGLFRAALQSQYPNLQARLSDPAVRDAVAAWLASDEALNEGSVDLLMNALEYLRPTATEADGAAVRSLLMHMEPFVRLAAYNFLVSLYFPDKNRQALLMVLNGMLSDEADAIRQRGAEYVERAGAGAELKLFLQRWLQTASARGWMDTDTYRLIDRLVKS